MTVALLIPADAPPDVWPQGLVVVHDPGPGTAASRRDRTEKEAAMARIDRLGGVPVPDLGGATG